MRKLFTLVALLSALALASASYAELSGSAVAHVRVVVSPNITITIPSPNVDAGSVQMGDFTATIQYRVDANKQEVSFYAEVSKLYKADDPQGTSVVPIPINLSEGVELKPANGNATGGHSNVMAFTTVGSTVEGYPTEQTEAVEYSSSQNNHFSQLVTVKVTYIQDDPERPTGEYSGVVKLTAFIVS